MKIFLAEASHRKAIRQFWYEIYVQEMGRHRNDAIADHNKRELMDPMLDVADVMLATNDENQIQGTVVLTQVDRVADKKYRELYGLDALSSTEQEHSVITTKLMVRQNLRKTRLPLKLVTAGYRHCLQNNYQWNFIDCNDHLVEFFHRLGFVNHRGQIDHADYGLVHSLRMHLQDSVHLRQISSPFYRPCIAHRITVDALDLNPNPTLGENHVNTNTRAEPNKVAAQSA